MGQADGNQSFLPGYLRPFHHSIGGVAPLSVQNGSRLQGLLGCRHHLGDLSDHRGYRFPVDHHAGDPDGDFVPDEMLGAVDHGVLAPGADDHAGNLSVGSHRLHREVVLALDHRIEAAPQAALYRGVVGINGADGLHHPLCLQNAAALLEAELFGDLSQIGCRKVHPADVGDQAGGIGEGGHLDGVLGAVQERAEHAGVVVLALEAVHPGDIVGIGLAEGQLEAGALAGGDQLESQRPRPVAELGGQGRLVSIGHAVKHARPVGHPFQQGPHQDVGFHRHHDQVLLLLDGCIAVGGADLGDAGGFHHHVHPAAEQFLGPGGHGRPIQLHGPVDFAGRFGDLDVLAGDPPEAQGPDRPFRLEIGNGRDSHAFDAAGLSHDLSSEGSGADDPDLDRTPFSLQVSQSLMKHLGIPLSSRPAAISGARPQSGPLRVATSRRKRSSPA